MYKIRPSIFRSSCQPGGRCVLMGNYGRRCDGLGGERATPQAPTQHGSRFCPLPLLSVIVLKLSKSSNVNLYNTTRGDATSSCHSPTGCPPAYHTLYVARLFEPPAENVTQKMTQVRYVWRQGTVWIIFRTGQERYSKSSIACGCCHRCV